MRPEDWSLQKKKKIECKVIKNHNVSKRRTDY